MPATKTSHPVGIKIYGVDRQLLEGATVVLTLNSETISGTSNSKGEVILNTANLTSGWSVGDEASITASKTGSGTKTQTLTLTSVPQQLNITLAETSDLTYYEESTTNMYVLNFSLITTYDGEKVTQSNRFPVSSETILNEPELTNTYDSRNRLSTQTITIRGTQYRRTFTYTGTAFQFTTRSAWIKQ